jgi:FkbM family methyltransferase
MNIEKYQTIVQKLMYTKLFRSPLWFLKKIQYRNYLPTQYYQTKMRIGHIIKLIPTQRYLYNTLINRQYHDENIFLAKRFITSSQPIIFDIGANIGLYTCAYAQYFKALNPRIIAIEAMESNYQLLVENVKLNGFENVTPIHIALGKESGELEFLVPQDHSVGNFAGNNITSPTEEDKNKMITKKVKMITLDELASQLKVERCDFMKVDIEGAEYFMFSGGHKFISQHRPVIQFEYNSYWLHQNQISFNHFYNFFNELNYDFYFEQKDYFQKIPNADSFNVTTDLVDILLVPKEKAIS